MTLRVSLEDTRRALGSPVNNAHQTWHERAGCLLRLENESGMYGVGEASPLPGFSRDALVDCRCALAGLDLRSVPARLETGQSVWSELERASRALPAALPAARAALEGALLDLWARAEGRPAWALLLDPDHPAPVSRQVAAVLMGEPEHALAEARDAQTRGIRTFKLKVGRRAALDRERRALSELRQDLGTDAKLRLDANRGFAVTDASALSELAAFHVEFIEEPFAAKDRASLAGLSLPIALDESLSELTPSVSDLQRWNVRAVVLKPTLLGGITACARWARAAKTAGAAVVLSHAFEGPHGLALSAALALTLGAERVAHGLDLASARVVAEWLPCFAGGQLHAWSTPGFGLTESAP